MNCQRGLIFKTVIADSQRTGAKTFKNVFVQAPKNYSMQGTCRHVERYNQELHCMEPDLLVFTITHIQQNIICVT
jgi:hypothetical protein